MKSLMSPKKRERKKTKKEEDDAKIKRKQPKKAGRKFQKDQRKQILSNHASKIKRK